MPKHARLFLLAVLLTRAIHAQAGNDGVLRDGFELPETRWTSVGGRGAFRIERLAKSNTAVHAGLSCVEAMVVADNDAPVYLSYEFPAARVIDELNVRVWIKSNRPRVQIFARVVLPRSPGADGRPLVAIVPGSVYSRVGSWQELEITNLSHGLSSQVRWMRTSIGPEVDVREAYVDRVLLNASGGLGATSLFIDDLTLTGIVPAEVVSTSIFRPVSQSSGETPPPKSPRTPPVRIRGPSLAVNDAPFFPRVITHCGEPLEFLRKLGFNTVRLAAPPNPQQAAEASRLGLWFICPPVPEPIGADDAFTGPPRVISEHYDRVLVWDLGRDFSAAELDRVKTQAESIRIRDRDLARPLVCGAVADLRAYSRCCDALVLDQSPIGTTLELPKYLAWLRDRPRLARLNTPIWATVQTEPLPEIVEQVSRLTAGRIREFGIESEQIRLLAYTALAGGARGLCFESRSRLDGNSAAARRRAQTLELLNLELALIEPWAATGNFTMTIPGSDPETLAAVLESNYSRILLPMWSGSGAQFVPGQLAGTNASFVVPGVPESTNVYEITAGNLPTPRHKRQAGGTRVTLDEFGLTSIILLTSDALAIQHVSNRVGAISERAAQLERELTVSRIRATMDADQKLASQGRNVARAQEWIRLAQGYAAQCDQAIAARDFQTAYLAAQRAVRPLRLLDRAHWLAITKDLPSQVTSPLSGNCATLPEHVALMASISSSQFVPTDLVGGDFEQMQVLGDAGWRHIRYTERLSEPLIKTGAELSAVNPHYGRNCLRFWAQPIDPAQAPSIVETPPVWIVSPPVQVSAGELIRFQGWVRISSPLSGSVDGLMIIDSIAGRALAERIETAADWKPFTFYRVATRSGPVTLTFALTGLGEVSVDDVTVERVARPRDLIRPIPQAALPNRPSLSSRLTGGHRIR